jgi:hypothetical protein
MSELESEVTALVDTAERTGVVGFVVCDVCRLHGSEAVSAAAKALMEGAHASLLRKRAAQAVSAAAALWHQRHGGPHHPADHGGRR